MKFSEEYKPSHNWQKISKSKYAKYGEAHIANQKGYAAYKKAELRAQSKKLSIFGTMHSTECPCKQHFVGRQLTLFKLRKTLSVFQEHDHTESWYNELS